MGTGRCSQGRDKDRDKKSWSRRSLLAIGIWHGAGATKSRSSVVSLFCSWRMSLCIRSNYDSGSWTTRIIHFSLLVFSTVSISLAIRNHSFRLQIQGRFRFRDISTVAIRADRVNLLHRLYTESTHQRSWKRSLFRKYHRTIVLTTANTEGMRRWLWQASIFFSWRIQSSYSGSNRMYYPLPSLVQDTMHCCLEYIFISDPMFRCEWATNLFRWKLVDWWTR